MGLLYVILNKGLKMHSQRTVYTISFLLLLILTSCGGAGSILGGTTGSGSGAETQASLPDTVDISSPDEQGLVTVTGTKAVTASTTVIITVQNSSTSLNFSLDPVLDFIVPSAHAQSSCETVTSSIPNCPSLSSNNKCKATADENGSFQIKVPATTSQTISVNYLDSTSCEEVSVLESFRINNNSPTLNMLAETMALDTDYGLLYIGGWPEESTDSPLVVYDIDTKSEVTANNISFDLITDIEIITQFDSYKTLLLSGVSGLSSFSRTTDEDDLSAIEGVSFKTLVGTIVDDSGLLATAGDLSNITFYQLIAHDHLQDYRSFDFQTTYNYDAATDTYPNCYSGLSVSESDTSETTYTRAFFTSDSQLFFHEYVDTIENTDITYFDSTQKTITLSSPIIYLTKNGTLSSDVLIEILYFSTAGNENYYHMIIKTISNETDSGYAYYYVKLPIDSTYLCSNLEIDLTNAIQFHPTDDEFSITTYESNNSDESATEHTLFVLDVNSTNSQMWGFNMSSSNEYMTITVDNTNKTYNYIDYDEVGNVKKSGTIDIGVTASGKSRISDKLSHIKSIRNPVTNDDELFFLSYNYGGSQFITDENNSESSYFELDSAIRAFYPIDLVYDPTTNQMIILDIGLSDYEEDFGLKSYLRFIELDSGSK